MRQFQYSSKNLFLFFIFLISFPVLVRSQTKDYPSLLWEVSGNGLTKPSYLYGTMHVSKKVAFHLTDAFFEGLKNTEAVALESNPETWLSEIMNEGLSMVNSSYYRNYYGAQNTDFYQKAFNFKIPTNKFIQVQIAKEPENVNSLLYRYNGNSGNFEEYTYLDLFIFQTAKKSYKPVVALEDFKTSLQMLAKSSMPDDDKEPLIRKAMPPYDIQSKIEDAYRNGDLDMLDSLNKLSYASKNFEKYMLLDRNVIMADNMNLIMKKQSLFTAIGAAHLPGEFGVISLLRKMGYTVKPVISSVSKKSIKSMNSFDEAHTPLVFQTQFSLDSTFKVDAPGKLFGVTGIDQMDSYLYTDMVNGSYYMIKRIKTFGLLREQDVAYQTRRIDSLLYESIPGKIIKKEAITANNGDPGFEIINKTRRGDLQHYRIYMSDKYIYIFKVAGLGDYVKTSDVDKFFRSITFKNEKNNESWTTYKPAFGGYEISIPANYNLIKPKDSNYQKEKITASQGFDYYMFTRSVLNDYYYIEEDTFELSQLSKNFYESLDFQLQSKEFGTYRSLPCITVSAKKKSNGSFLHFRIVLKDQQYFLLACKSNSKEAPANFLNSLKFNEFKHEQMETYVDTSYYYSATTDYKEAKKSFFEELSNPMSYYYSKLKKPMPYLNWDKDKTIESPSTGEAIGIYVLKCSDFRMDRSLDDFWKTQTDHYILNTSLHIKEQKKFEKNGLQGLDLVLNDTNSVKQIRTRMYQKEGLLYIIHTTSDTVSGLSSWANTFFETFKLSDTVIGRSIFEDKINEFLTDAASKDSTTREKVEAVYFNIVFADKHATALMKFMGSADFNNASWPVRTSLIRKLGGLKDPQIVSFLKNEYPKYVDSASFQLSILQALANQRTEQGTKAFLQCLINESPLSNSEYEVSDIFRPFYDSLKVARSLFPQLLDITRYMEYKSSIYGLLSSLLDSSIVTSQVYAVGKNDVLRQANEELKRQKAEENNKVNTSSNTSFESDYGGNDDISRAMSEALAAAKMAEMEAQAASDNYIAPNYLLVDYADLLAPYYAETSVKIFFDKAFKTKDPDFKISLIGILLKNSLSVADTMIDNLAKDPKTRIAIYSKLKKINKLNKIKPEYLTQRSLVEAMLFGQKNIPADSIKFITTKYVESKDQSGVVYFYRSTNKVDGQLKLNFIAFESKDSTSFQMPPAVVNSRIIYPKDDINKMVDEVCYELSLNGRKRVKKSYWNNYDYSDFSYGEED